MELIRSFASFITSSYKRSATALIIFGILLAIPFTLGLISQQQETRSRAAPTAKLYFNPEFVETSPQCQSFDVDVMIDPAENVVSIVDFQLSYDPSKLAFASIGPSAEFPTVIKTGGVDGQVYMSVSIGSDISRAVQQKARVATIKFKAIGTGSTRLQINQNQTRIFSVAPADQPTENVLFSVSPAQVGLDSNVCAVTGIPTPASGACGNGICEYGEPVCPPVPTCPPGSVCPLYSPCEPSYYAGTCPQDCKGVPLPTPTLFCKTGINSFSSTQDGCSPGTYKIFQIGCYDSFQTTIDAGSCVSYVVMREFGERACFGRQSCLETPTPWIIDDHCLVPEGTPLPLDCYPPSKTPIPTASPTKIPPLSTYLNVALEIEGVGTNSALGLNIKPRRQKRYLLLEIIDSSGKVIQKGSVGTLEYDPARGVFVGIYPISDPFKSGEYTIKARTEYTLWKNLPGIQKIQEGTTNIVPQTKLIAGDFNSDNVINLLDYNMLISCIKNPSCNPTLPSPSGPPQLDIVYTAQEKDVFDMNDDGKVEELDLNILYAGFRSREGD